MICYDEFYRMVHNNTGNTHISMVITCPLCLHEIFKMKWVMMFLWILKHIR